MRLLLIIVFLTLSFPNKILEPTLPLGRDKDPKVTEDISKFKLWYLKRQWELLTSPGLRFMTSLIYPKTTISHIETTDSIVAFTIDDGFCGKDNQEGCMINQVRELFKKYDSKATFFTTGSHCPNNIYDDVLKLLNDGHELANHGMFDHPYNKFSYDDFKKDLELTDSILINYTTDIPKFYRAPHAKLSDTMQKIIDEKELTHFVCDAFANDTSIPDAKWISEYILNKVQPGSILLIHMPEKNIREWNYEAMELTLKGLKEKNYKVVTLTELYKLK